MQTKTTLRGLLSFVVVGSVVASTFSCSNINEYAIDSPSWMQSQIDSIAAAKAALVSDTTWLTLAPAEVGAQDGSNGWNTAYSQAFEVPAGKLLHLEFYNYGTKANNYSNWNFRFADADYSASSYTEYFLIRSDLYGWGNDDYSSALLTSNYNDVLANDGDIWDEFKEEMYGAYTVIELDNSAAGNAFLTATMTCLSGKVLQETYNQPVGATGYASLVCDNSWFILQDGKCYLIPSKIEAVEDVAPASISATGMPTMIEVKADTVEYTLADYWGDKTVATVTYADGTTATADTADISFTVPDLHELGTYTILYSYSKTKQGNYGAKTVAGSYTVSVVNPVKSMEVTAAPSHATYYVYEDSVAFDPTGLEITATFVDGSTGVLSNDALVFGKVPAEAGEAKVAVSYYNSADTVTTTVPVKVIKGLYAFGATDYSNGWWSTFSKDYTVAAGKSVTIKMFVYSLAASNWQGPTTVLRNLDYANENIEYVVVRQDNYGWGNGYAGLTATKTYPDTDGDGDIWDDYLAGLSFSDITLTITNAGDGTGSIHYDIVNGLGVSETMYYDSIPLIDGAGVATTGDIIAAIANEESYIVVYGEE